MGLDRDELVKLGVLVELLLPLLIEGLEILLTVLKRVDEARSPQPKSD